MVINDSRLLGHTGAHGPQPLSPERTRCRRAPSARTPTRTPALVVLALTGMLVLAGCTGKSGSSAARPGRQATAKGLTLAGAWPLTGLPARGQAPTHPVMVVKIDNTASSSPQHGLGRADLVTEELVEGGSTRLAVFFYQHIPKLVGPVRSMRATDIGIVKPAKAVVVASGGAPPTVRRVKAAGIRAFTEGAVGYFRDPGRQAPYNLFMHLSRLAKKVSAEQTVNELPAVRVGKPTPKGQRAAGLAAVFSGGHTTSWSYQGGKYTNENSFAAAGDRFRPDNVLVLRVRVGDAGYLDPAGHAVPETHFTGTGKALLFHGGRVVRGTWKKSLTSPISLRTKGTRLTVPTGHTWVELVPKNGGSVVIKR